MGLVYSNINLKDNNPIISWKLLQSSFGKQALDDIICDLIICSEDEEEIERQKGIFDKIEEIAETYLTLKERLIFKCYIDNKKKISHIMRIAGFDDWRTTSNNLKRVFKILKLYYDYENLDHRNLNKVINKNFNPREKQIIQLLEDRYTIHEIKDKLGYHYSKVYSIIKNILQRLSKLPEPCLSYYEFLIEIRKFKKLKDYKLDGNRIKS